MITKEVYVCEKCRLTYGTAEEAVKCENSHCLPISVSVRGNYKVPIDETHNGYPLYVIVSMSNGKKCEYHYGSEEEEIINKGGLNNESH